MFWVVFGSFLGNTFCMQDTLCIDDFLTMSHFLYGIYCRSLEVNGADI